jgi:mannosylfructose-phosphate synthase
VITTHGGLYRAVTYGRHAIYADAFDREDLGISIVHVLKHGRLWVRL